MKKENGKFASIDVHGENCIVVCKDLHNIIVEVLTDNATKSINKLFNLFSNKVKCVYGNEAYDTEQCYKAS